MLFKSLNLLYIEHTNQGDIMFEYNEISRNLKKYLAQSRIQQKELALACGKTEGTISHWVEGRVNIPTKYIPKICEMLDISLYELFGLPDPGLLSAGERKVLNAYRTDEIFKVICDRILSV